MPKRIVEDVVPPERRSIRNIPLPESRGSSFDNEELPRPTQRPARENVRRTPVQDEVQIRPPARAPSKVPPSVTSPKAPKVKKSRKKIGIFFLVLLCVAVVGIALSFAFKNATVTITPKQQILPVNISVSAHTEAGKADVLYQTFTLTKEKNVEIPATGEESVERKASGTIIVYNNFSSEPQVLVKNTRFRTLNNLIYRIQEQITVPGKKGTTPGSIKVTVYADEAGEKYNTGLQDFVIPGFESDPARFKAIVAKSDPTSPLKGGFVGTIKKVSDSDKEKTGLTLETDLKKEIMETIAAQIPAGYMSIQGGLFVAFEDIAPTDGSTAGTAKFGKRATAQAIIVNEEQFEEQIISITSGDAENGPKTMRIRNLKDLPVTIEKTPTSEDPLMKIGIRGDLDFVSKINTEELASSLAGKSRKNMKAIFSSYSSIEKAEAVIRPLWSTTFPNNPKKVYIEVLEP